MINRKLTKNNRLLNFLKKCQKNMKKRKNMKLKKPKFRQNKKKMRIKNWNRK